ncbi:MAG TPA: MerR family DNA-binding transcriptional regulator, partial [Candidatus Saccharimonadales bacterium]|nr:MerR family DNA-binding transcriptional regulator [Candidatus Saccharimonadales bacterium]
MNDRLLTIQEAAKLLKVSTKTLRRWEKQGKLIAQRTIGNQRRYTLTQVTAFKQKPFTPVAAISSARVGQLGSEFEKDHASFAEASKNTLVEELGEEHHLISVLRNINDHINAPQKYMVIGYLSVFVVLLSATVLVKTGTVKLPAAGKSALGTVTQKIASDFVNPSQAVLAAATSPLNDILKVNVKSQFAQDADFLSDVRIKGQLAVTNVASFSAQTFFGGDLTATDHNLDLGTGKITASNVVYGITAGTGISISGGQNPVITNTDPASGLKIFSKFIVAGTNMPATSNNDVITLTQGTGITLSAAPGAGTNQITIAATDLGPWTVNGSSVVLKTTSNNVGIGTTTAGQKLDVNGNINVSGNLIFSSSTPVIQSSSNITFTPQNGATGGAIVPLSADATDLGSPSLEFRNIYAQNFIPGSSGVSGFWQRPAGTGSIAPSNITDSINIGGIATSSALEHFAGTSGENSFFNTGNVGIGTTNPQALLHIRSSNDGSEKLMLVLDNSGDSVNTASGIGFNTNGSYTQTAKIVDLRTNESGQGDTALTFYVQDNAGGSPPGLTEKMRINARGNVGIGSTNPGSLLDVSGNVRATTFNGNTLTTGTGTLTLPAGKTVSFADAFQTSGAFSLVLTTTGATNVTLPTTGTLLTNTAAANQTITSTQQSGTVLGVSDTTNITGAIIGQSVTLSGTGAFDQTGLKFNLSGASGANLNDIVGTSSSWKIATTGDATFNSVSTNSFNSGSISSSGTILGPDGSAASPSFAFTNSTHTGLFRAGADILGVSTNSTERMRIDSNGNVGIGTTSPIGLVNIVGAPVGKALVNLNYTGTDQNIFVASKSGVTKFVIDNTGTITTGIWQGTPIATSSGGTGQVAYIGGDILYAAGPTTLSPLHIGSTNQVLAVSSSGLPVWATAGGGGGGLCSDCLINDPTVSSTNTVTPGASSVTALTLLGAVSDNANIFTVKNHSAGSTYFNINSSGVIDSGTWQGTAVGAQYGGTGQTLYGVGDLLYADTTTHLTRLPVGSQNQVLTISNSTNLPVWSTGSGGGGFCSDCLVSDPTTSLIN